MTFGEEVYLEMKALIESGSTKLSSYSPTKLYGEFATFDELNQNNRVYPNSVYKEALKPLMDQVSRRALMGECDHPIDYDEVRLSNVSHLITKLKVKGNKVYGEVELLDTPAGRIVKALKEAGVPIGISSRAVGDSVLREDGYEEVTNMQLITYDLVADPSFKEAVLSESTKETLGESLSKIEESISSSSLNESKTARKMIKSIQETLLHNRSVDIDVAGLEVQSLKSILDKKVLEISRLKESHKALSESIKTTADTLNKTRSDLVESTSRLSSLRSNMERLQDEFNYLHETTVSKSDYDKVVEESVDLRKRLIVESRGLSYSQVRKFLEGATTEKEILSRLDSIPKRMLSSNPVINELRESSTRRSIDSKVQSEAPSKLGTIISRI